MKKKKMEIKSKYLEINRRIKKVENDSEGN